MGYYDGNDLPYYYALAQTFAISDRHFSSALAPTWPNRMFYFAGTSWGFTDNQLPAGDGRPTACPTPTCSAALDAAKVELARLFAGPSDAGSSSPSTATSTSASTSSTPPTSSATCQAGNLAQVTIVEASDVLGADSPDEGPPGDVDIGQQFISGIIGAIMNSPFWKSSVIFLSYDENGGMYDHVVPPAACPPDDIACRDGTRRRLQSVRLPRALLRHLALRQARLRLARR